MSFFKECQTLFLGLDTMYKNKIMHYDIKSGNITYIDNRYKYIDFGISTTFDDNKKIEKRALQEFNTNRIYIYYPFDILYLYASKPKLYIEKYTHRKSYDELKGTVRLEDMNKNSLKIISKKNMVDIMNFHIYQVNPNVSYNILIKKDYTICYYKNNKLTKVTKFPFSKKTSLAFLQQCIKKKYDYLPNFINDYSFSKKILSNYANIIK